MTTLSLLWSLRPPEGRPSYMFGTMHIRDERVYTFCDTLYPLIRQADVYVGEMDLNDAPQHNAMPLYNMMDYFRPDVYHKLRQQLLKSFKLDVHRFAHLHPMMIMSAISHNILVNDHAVSLDEHLWNFAGTLQLTRQGLESMEEQMALLHSIDPEPLYVQIKEISSRPQKLRAFTGRALELYTKGEIHKLYQLTKASMHQLRKRIIYDRNRVMADRIHAFNRDLVYFITVGAGHLSGPSGLISLLRTRGWKVSPVSF